MTDSQAIRLEIVRILGTDILEIDPNIILTFAHVVEHGEVPAEKAEGSERA